MIDQLRDLAHYHLADRLARLEAVRDDPSLRVVVFGEFNRGKSTLLNALLGRALLQAKLVPTTGQVTRLRHGTPEAVRVSFADGRSAEVALERLSHFADLRADGTNTADLHAIDVTIDSTMLDAGLVLIDTPGVCDAAEQMRRAVDALDGADAVLFVLDARQLLGEAERAYAKHLTDELGKPVAFAVNFMNAIDDAERDGLRQRLNAWCAAHLRAPFGKAWYEVDALGALRHALGFGPAPADDFATLRHDLTACRGEIRERLCERSRRAQLLGLLAEAGRANAAIRQCLLDDADGEACRRAAERTRLADLHRRWPDLAALERERLSAAARSMLDERGAVLGAAWHTLDEAHLAQTAASEYETALLDAARHLERTAFAALVNLAPSRPEPFALADELQRTARLDVAALVRLDSPVSVVSGAVARAVAAVIDADAGRRVRGWIVRWFGVSAAAPIRDAGRKKWATDANQLQNLLRVQYDARVAGVARELGECLCELEPSDELARRTALDAAIRDRIEREAEHRESIRGTEADA